MLVMVVFFIAFRWIHLSTPLIRLFLLVLILLLMPTLNFLPVWFRSEERFSRNAETDLVCRLLLEKKNGMPRYPRLLQPISVRGAAVRYSLRRKVCLRAKTACTSMHPQSSDLWPSSSTDNV